MMIERDFECCDRGECAPLPSTCGDAASCTTDCLFTGKPCPPRVTLSRVTETFADGHSETYRYARVGAVSCRQYREPSGGYRVVIMSPTGTREALCRSNTETVDMFRRVIDETTGAAL